MAEQNEVAIRFTAETGKFAQGIANVQGALAGLKRDVGSVAGAAAGLRSAFAAALPSVGAFGDQTARAALQLKSIGTEIKLLHQGLAER